MNYGQIKFCCENKDCPVALQIAKIILEFVLIVIASKRHTRFQVELTELGIAQETWVHFRRSFILHEIDNRMKLVPQLSCDKLIDGDELLNIF